MIATPRCATSTEDSRSDIGLTCQPAQLRQLGVGWLLGGLDRFGIVALDHPVAVLDPPGWTGSVVAVAGPAMLGALAGYILSTRRRKLITTAPLANRTSSRTGPKRRGMVRGMK